MYQHANLATKSEFGNMKMRVIFVDGTSQQLARYLYDIHSDPSMCSFRAIQIAGAIMGENSDRAHISKNASMKADSLATQKAQLTSREDPTQSPRLFTLRQEKKNPSHTWRNNGHTYSMAKTMKRMPYNWK